MKAVVSELSADSLLRKQPCRLEHEVVVGLIFALKTYAASMLALFIAFWAALDDPRWAFLTVFVVSQPDSGLVLAKSFYRMLGTVCAVLFTIALVFAVAQYGELFLAAVAAWICVCTFASRAVRNFASYGFVLAGYTVAIVGIPAALDPSGAYPLIVARFTEISVGIACAALVSRLVFVSELSPKLVTLVRWLTRRQDRFAAILLDPAADRERVAAERAQLVQDFVSVETMQQSAFFESADARLLGQPLRKLTHAAVELCAVAEAAATHRVSSVPDHEADTGNATSHCREASAAAGATASSLVRAADDRAVRSARLRLQQCVAAFERGEDLSEPKTACRLWSDPVPAALAGIRSALAIAITSAFWFVTAWPNGSTAVVVAAVVSSLFSTMQQPEKISVACAATILLSAVPAFVTQYHLLPLAQDFPSLAVALAPLVLTCSFIMAQPRIGPLGLLSVVYFAFATNISNVSTYDAVAFLNSSLAITLGIGVAAVLFAAFFPETPACATRRFRRQVLVHLGRLASACPCPPALQCYQRALCEQLSATLARLKDEPTAARECFASGVTALSTAQAIGRLRRALDAGTLPTEIIAAGTCLLARLSRMLCNASKAKSIQTAWAARALRRRALAAMRASAPPRQIEALGAVVAACETLRCDLMTGRIAAGGINAFRA
jgi:uncharacterized membrane protein YccC